MITFYVAFFFTVVSHSLSLSQAQKKAQQIVLKRKQCVLIRVEKKKNGDAISDEVRA